MEHMKHSTTKHPTVRVLRAHRQVAEAEEEEEEEK